MFIVLDISDKCMRAKDPLDDLADQFEKCLQLSQQSDSDDSDILIFDIGILVYFSQCFIYL